VSVTIDACDSPIGPQSNGIIEKLSKITHVMNAGVSCDDKLAYLFYIFLLLAMVLVFLLCRTKFEQFSEGNTADGGGDYVSRLLPRYLATRREYSTGLSVYVASMAFMVSLLSIFGPTDPETFKKIFFNIDFSKDFTFAAQPLLMTLLFLGVLPNFPVLQEIEKWFRRRAHKYALIPTAARKTAERLLTADFDFSSYGQMAAISSAELRSVEPSDFGLPAHSLEHIWARLCCLAYEIERRRMAGDFGLLDEGLLRRYAGHLDSIEERRKSLEGEVALYRTERSNNADYSNYTLHRKIRNTLDQLYILLGCAARLKSNTDEDVNLALQPFGFKLESPATQIQEPHSTRGITPSGINSPPNLVGIAAIPLGVLALGLAAVGVAHLNLWTVSPLFPQVWLVDTASATVLYGTAILVGDLIRARSIEADVWFGTADPRRKAVNYLGVAFASGVAGYTMSILLGLAFAPFSLSWSVAALPLLILPAVTGAFYVYHLDNVHLQTPSSRRRDIGWQAAVTGVCGLVATTLSFKILFADGTLKLDQIMDQILFATVVSAAIGASLGCYIPQAAAASRYGSFAGTNEDRIPTFKAA
jgi:hypothetical protein